MTTEQTLTWHGITLCVDFDFYPDDLSVHIHSLAVIVDGERVGNITHTINKDGIEEIQEAIVTRYLSEGGLPQYQIDTALLLRRITAN